MSALRWSVSRLNFRPQFGLRILLQQRLQTLFSFARVRNVAIRQTHLTHFGFRDLHHCCVSERIGRKVS